MRLVVASDSHGAAWRLADAVRQQPDAAALFFLGDGESDLRLLREQYPGLKIYAVSGNCDGSCSNLPELDAAELAGVKIMFTHGHRYAVKSTEENLLAAARARGAQIALYGHTHKPSYRYEDGVHLFNPGSAEEHSYGVVDITGAGIFCFHCKV
ncbi:MAG: YfcE family phosphodiesterase [Oscillospiraceae bacterium]|jgi:putative phosphoesterase|nr:YfcE family phosphodiesterase [Oscillospiraceae bacterium]